MGKAVLSLLMFAVYFCNCEEVFAIETVNQGCSTTTGNYSLCSLGNLSSVYNCNPGGLCYPGRYSYMCIKEYEGECALAENLKEELCPYVPESLKAVAGCPIPPATPEEICEKYKNLFDPPSQNCIFQMEYGNTCESGDGRVIYGSYRLRASDGRISEWQSGERSAADEGVECQVHINSCGNPDGCWRQIDLGNCTYKDSDGNLKLKEECLKNNSTPPESGWSELCEMGLVECSSSGGTSGGGGGGGGGGTPGTGTGDESGDNGGGGTPGGGGDGGSGGGSPGGTGTPGGGGTPGGSGGDNGGSTGGGSGGDGGGGDTPGTGTPGGGGVVVINPGGNGGGTGNGESGTGSNDTGEKEGFDGNFGSSSDAENAANNGGWGDGKGD